MDVSDPAHPVATAYLASTALIDPWESLKINQKRGLLAGVNGLGGGGGSEFDVYDLTQDCTHPKLLASVALGGGIKGHEGSWAPDGLTYYGGDVYDAFYYAVDLRDPTAPKLIAQWKPPDSSPPKPPGLAVHGLSISDDGNRGYFTLSGSATINVGNNGFYIVDISEVQARKPNPQFKVLSTVKWGDGASAQHTIPVRIQGHPYLIHSDELGTGGFGSSAGWASSCAQNMAPFGMARIYDIADETAPRLAARVMTEVQDVANCQQVIGDNTGTLIEGYDSHYCAVDDPAQASILMCSQFASGLRVYDIRNPYHPKELAYYNPTASPGYKPGAAYNFTGICGLTDWTTSMPAFHKDSGEIWFTSNCNGFQVVKLSNGVWPLR
jgi:hypothetical protein